MPSPSRRALLAAFLAAPVAVRLAPFVKPAVAPVVAEVAQNIFVRDMGLWFASFPEMYRAFNWDFRGHTVEMREGFDGCWGDMAGKPDGVMGYIMNNRFRRLGPPPEPLKVPCFGIAA